MLASARYVPLLEKMTRKGVTLRKALLAEREAIAGYDNQVIESKLTQKLEALKALKGNIEQRRPLLIQAGATINADGHQQYVSMVPGTWQERIELAATAANNAIGTCQHENQSDAAVLQLIKRKADSIKTIISGGEGQALRGAKGET